MQSVMPPLSETLEENFVSILESIKRESEEYPIPTIDQTRDCAKLELGNEMFVSVTFYGGRTRVHIRKFDERGFPTKTGTWLTPTRWTNLTRNMPLIDVDVIRSKSNQLDTMQQYHIGGPVFVTIDPRFPGVDIRAFYLPFGQTTPQATKKGVFLKFAQWEKLCEYAPRITSSDINLGPTLALPCTDTHFFNEKCDECSPFR